MKTETYSEHVSITYQYLPRFLPQNSSALSSKPPPSFGISYSNYKSSTDYKSPTPHSRYTPNTTPHYTSNVRQLTSRSSSPGMVNVIQSDESISSMLFISLPVTETVRKRQVEYNLEIYVFH